MRSRLTRQLTLLVFSIGVIAALAMPGSAAAAMSVDLAGGYANGVANDADDEGNGVVHDEGAQIPFLVTVTNTGDEIVAAGDLTINGTFQVGDLADPFYVEPIADADVTVTSGITMTCVVNGAGSNPQCISDVAFPVGASVTVQVLATTVENSFENNGLTTQFDAWWAEAAGPGGQTPMFEETTDVRDLYDVQCDTTWVEAASTRAQLQSDGNIVVALPCVDEDDGDASTLSFAPVVGTTGTLTDAGAGSSATYTPTAATLASPRGVQEMFDVTVQDDEGTEWDLTVWVKAFTQSDLALTLDGPTSQVVAVGGTNVTYRASIRNFGPDAQGRHSVMWSLSSRATVVSATANGAATTCEPGDGGMGGPDTQMVFCPAGDVPAVGESSVATITVRYAAGEQEPTLPSSVDTTAWAATAWDDNVEDPNFDNGSGSLATALTAASTTTTTTTTDDDTTTTATGGPDTYRGTTGGDTFSGGSGADVFSGFAGDDRFYGGTGADVGFGGAGDDYLNGGLGGDLLAGGDGRDRAFGASGNDRVFGGMGNDLVSGGPGNDLVRGGTGADVVYCGSGLDKALGDGGNDIMGCRDGRGGDLINGGTGRDLCIGDVGDVFVSCERRFRF